MQRFRFEVQGSEQEPYQVEISRDGTNLTATCTCRAGQMGQYCKHRFSLLSGSADRVVGGDIEAISSLPELMKGTDVEAAIENVGRAEAAKVIAEKSLSAAKRALARAMSN